MVLVRREKKCIEKGAICLDLLIVYLSLLIVTHSITSLLFDKKNNNINPLIITFSYFLVICYISFPSSTPNNPLLSTGRLLLTALILTDSCQWIVGYHHNLELSIINLHLHTSKRCLLRRMRNSSLNIHATLCFRFLLFCLIL